MHEFLGKQNVYLIIYSYNLKWSILHECGQKVESAVKSFLSPRNKSEFHTTYQDKANSLSENWKMRSSGPIYTMPCHYQYNSRTPNLNLYFCCQSMNTL